ncbi:hypothetical protein [Clostridium intestinale]|uniref:Uncharacterized protein n=1 Tax=Clostridium intestinale URNW TaxID=1294142 RepID=U2Q269_9CLOT|nr:hypothetical protein [Clostridium intestinale]ERK30149.1 hypothetical protein CINTURNW_1269 [Clostridium intestinale URNW]
MHYTAIDNNISSGRNNGISNVNSSIEEVVSLIQELDSATLQYLQLNISPYDIASRNKLLHNFLRSFRYNGFIWLATIGLIEGGFTDYLVRYNNQLLKRIDPYIQNPDSLTAYINNKGTDPFMCNNVRIYIFSCSP